MLCGCLSASRSVARDVEELLAQRGIVVTYETVRQWCGARLGRRTQTDSAGAALGVGTSGIWMKCI